MSRRQTRSEARECAFSLVFQIGTEAVDIDFMIEQLTEEKPESIINLEYIRDALSGVSENITKIDERISAVLPANRGIKRLSKTVLSILRLAVYEIDYVEDIPEKVAINEAVELAKKYAEDDAAQFVNGVLSGVVS
ncbi:MAG: transcription antitermination factor NusB [Eubacteriales bacterium]|nr:transcription antitermination factor NusB [Eubacteriales bacterium]